MRLLDLRKTGSATYGGPITLDDLWERASALGRVTVEHSFGQGQFVQIKFDRRGGSTVWAKGYHSEIREAFRLAIEEALALGARP